MIKLLCILDGLLMLLDANRYYQNIFINKL